QPRCVPPRLLRSVVVRVHDVREVVLHRLRNVLFQMHATRSNIEIVLFWFLGDGTHGGNQLLHVAFLGESQHDVHRQRLLQRPSVSSPSRKRRKVGKKRTLTILMSICRMLASCRMLVCSSMDTKSLYNRFSK